MPYPPCVASQDTENVVVQDCCFLNPYEAIRLVRAARHLVRNITGYPIWRGLLVDDCLVAGFTFVVGSRPMKLGLCSITYRGIWYKGPALDLEQLVRLAKSQGWEGLELDTERPHAAPMDLSADNRKRLRGLSGEVELPLCAVSPNCDLSSPSPSHREAMICCVRECIKLARDLGAPLCKIFAAWRGIILHDMTNPDGLGIHEAAARRGRSQSKPENRSYLKTLFPA